MSNPTLQDSASNVPKRPQHDFFDDAEKDHIKKLARAWYELPSERRNRERKVFLNTELAKFRELFQDKFHPEDRALVKMVSNLDAMIGLASDLLHNNRNSGPHWTTRSALSRRRIRDRRRRRRRKLTILVGSPSGALLLLRSRRLGTFSLKRSSRLYWRKYPPCEYRRRTT